ncbi:MAG: hypothetical protein KF788_08915 [Piscinibacter sp.]|nr:hypothetical protein [Piscinibacter sp.]
MSDFDPVQYGQLLERVDSLDEEVRELRRDVKALLELANKSRGGFWMGMAIASSVGGVVGFLVDHLGRR